MSGARLLVKDHFAYTIANTVNGSGIGTINAQGPLFSAIEDQNTISAFLPVSVWDENVKEAITSERCFRAAQLVEALNLCASNIVSSLAVPAAAGDQVVDLPWYKQLWELKPKLTEKLFLLHGPEVSSSITTQDAVYNPRYDIIRLPRITAGLQVGREHVTSTTNKNYLSHAYEKQPPMHADTRSPIIENTELRIYPWTFVDTARESRREEMGITPVGAEPLIVDNTYPAWFAIAGNTLRVRN